MKSSNKPNIKALINLILKIKLKIKKKEKKNIILINNIILKKIQ
jgi:hypothetical protein